MAKPDEAAVDPDAAAIAEFHAAARRRNVRIFAIAGILCLAIGVGFVVVAVTAGETIDHRHYGWGRSEANELKTIVGGIAFVAAGIGMLWNAYRIRRGAPLD